MPFTMTKTETASVGTDSFRESFTNSGNSMLPTAPSVSAAKIGQLTTRTSNTVGTLTMASGHGFVSTDKIDIFWTVGGVYGSQRAATATVTGDSVAFTGGTGDNLPVNLSAVTAMKPTTVAYVVTGNNVVGLAVGSSQGGYVVFVDGGGDLAAATFTLTPTSPGSSWTLATGETNPLAGKTTTQIKFSHGYSSGPVEMKGVTVYS